MAEGKQVRQRGPEPTLSDSEVLTMEVVGEFLGMDDESALYRYFRWHWAAWFPRLLCQDRWKHPQKDRNKIPSSDVLGSLTPPSAEGQVPAQAWSE